MDKQKYPENQNFHDDLWEVRVSDYLDGRLKGGQATLFETHLDGCERCKREVKDLRLTLKALRHLNTVTPPAPRSFAISDTQARRLRPTPVYRAVLSAGAVAAALLICFLALDLLGVFTVTITQKVVLGGVPTDLPTLGTIGTTLCPTPGDAGSVCANSSQTGGAIIYAPDPPTRTVTTLSKDSFVTMVELILGGLVVTFTLVSFSLRPRAPGKFRANRKL